MYIYIHIQIYIYVYVYVYVYVHIRDAAFLVSECVRAPRNWVSGCSVVTLSAKMHAERARPRTYAHDIRLARRCAHRRRHTTQAHTAHTYTYIYIHIHTKKNRLGRFQHDDGGHGAYHGCCQVKDHHWRVACVACGVWRCFMCLLRQCCSWGCCI